MMCFLIIFQILPTSPNVRGENTLSGKWNQSSQADFQADTLNNLVYDSGAGGVVLASGGSIVSMGYDSIYRPSSSKGNSTYILTGPGTGASTDGIIEAVRFYAFSSSVGSGTISLKVFRDDGTNYVYIDGATFSNPTYGINDYSTYIPVKRGDLLAFSASGPWTIAGGNGGYAVYQSADISYTTAKSAWTASGYFYCIFFPPCFRRFQPVGVFSFQADLVPNVKGNLVSTVGDTGGNSTWRTLNWTAAVPFGASISFNTRTSNDSVAWSNWSSSKSSTGMNITSPSGRFVQYSATFSAQGTITPVLMNVTISYVSISLSVPVPTTTVGSSLTVTGAISPSVSGAVTLTYTRPDGSTVMRTVTSASGLLTDSYAPDRVGSWSVRAFWPGMGSIPSVESFPQTFQVRPQPPSILVISVSIQTISTGGSIQITGMISPATASSVILTLTAPDGTNTTQALSSNSAGLFQYSFSPNRSGLWQVKASWAGTAQTAGSQSNVQTFQVQEPPSFLSSTLPWLILIAVVAGFAVAVILTKPKQSKMG